jgi:hypothetical protein
VVVGALNNAQAVAWICLIVGIALSLTGAGIGGFLSWTKAPADAKKALDTAKTKVEDTQKQLASGRTGGLEAAGAGSAAASADAAKSALDQVQGIVSSLPENLRFAGMLVLIGAVLMSVATIQFGGVSLF